MVINLLHQLLLNCQIRWVYYLPQGEEWLDSRPTDAYLVRVSCAIPLFVSDMRNMSWRLYGICNYCHFFWYHGDLNSLYWSHDSWNYIYQTLAITIIIIHWFKFSQWDLSPIIAVFSHIRVDRVTKAPCTIVGSSACQCGFIRPNKLWRTLVS